MRRLKWPILMFTTLILLPGTIWYQQTRPLSIYLTDAVPDGQLLFVLSKLIGLVVLMCIAWQMIVTLLCKLELIPASWVGNRHHVFGGIILFLALLHGILFVAAVSLRQGEIAWQLLVPDFRDYYHTHLTFGLFGLLALFIAALAGIFRMISCYVWSVFLHRAYWLSIGFVYLHALAIGSEAQSRFGFVLYVALGITVIGLLCLYSFKRFKLRAVAS